MKINVIIRQIVLIGAVFFSSCERDYLKQAPKPIKGAEPTVFFATDLEPFLNSKCGSCHNVNGNSKPFLKLKTGFAYDGIMKNPNGRTYADTLAPASSLFYIKCAPGGSMNQYLTPPELTKILTWITEGAKNN